MRRLGTALCAATLIALAPSASAVAAVAADPAGVNVDPSSATPGSEVKISATGCDGDTAAARSKAFVADGTLTPQGGKRSPLSGEAMIRSTVTPGTYGVSVACDGQEGKAKGSFTVVRDKPSPSPSGSPTAPSRAGGGGTAAHAAHTDEGPGTRHAVIGGVLATAAGLAVGGRILRRRRR